MWAALDEIKPGSLSDFRLTAFPRFNETEQKENKPDRATMRPDCLSVCIEHMTYMERQIDKQTRVVKEVAVTKNS